MDHHFRQDDRFSDRPHVLEKGALLMSQIIIPQNRRVFLSTVTVGAALLTARGLFADELVRTPSQMEGPFYPNKLPLDTDNDLLVINDGITPAVGEVTPPFIRGILRRKNTIRTFRASGAS
jgi:hypothetical protein